MADEKEKQIVKTGLHQTGGRDVSTLIDSSISSLDNERLNQLKMKAAEKALDLEIKSRELNLDYVDGKKKTEDHIETWDMLNKTGRTTRHTVVTEIKSSNSNMKIESKSGATCFVATAAYNDPNHPDVVLLRRYRDERLSEYRLGQWFIKKYWIHGPRIARSVENKPAIRKMAKTLISKAVLIIKRIERW